MGAARALYERNGFQLLTGPEGNTGHFGCDMWYARQL
jgi:putative acetyltransferase